jgi:hypothetical protein
MQNTSTKHNVTYVDENNGVVTKTLTLTTEQLNFILNAAHELTITSDDEDRQELIDELKEHFASVD